MSLSYIICMKAFVALSARFSLPIGLWPWPFLPARALI